MHIIPTVSRALNAEYVANRSLSSYVMVNGFHDDDKY